MKTQITLLLLFLAFVAFAQEDSYNLVPNPSFEKIDKKVKGPGEIERAQPWVSVTGTMVDLYHNKAKDRSFGVPDNAYGKEDAKTGDAYAGVNFFGFRGRVPRSYLGTPLKEPLEAGKEYCLKFHVSLSDMSMYAVNNIGMHLSTEMEVQSADPILNFNPQLVPLPNKVYDQQFLWQEICDQYTARGGEQFLIIGNFRSDDETQQERMRLSREFSGQQQRDAYYFIDDVSVIPMDKVKKGDCNCNLLAGGRATVQEKSFSTEASKRSSAKQVYFINSDGSRASETTKKETVAEAENWTLEDEFIFFSTNKDVPNASEEKKLAKIVEYLNENPSVKIEAVGRSDKSETTSSIARKRAFRIQKMLIDLGIDSSRISYTINESDQDVNKVDASLNQHVYFKIK